MKEDAEARPFSLLSLVLNSRGTLRNSDRLASEENMVRASVRKKLHFSPSGQAYSAESKHIFFGRQRAGIFDKFSMRRGKGVTVAGA